MPGGKITYYVDIVSPFCYLGYYFLRVCDPHQKLRA
jgi:predicted DsbA family dithiol-disulfide isomerase